MRSLPKFGLVFGLLSIVVEYGVANGPTHGGDSQAIGGCRPHQWASEISLAENRFTLAVDGCRFTFRGDESDRGQVLIDVGGRAQPLIYRLWPDLAKWRLTAEGKVLYAKEFEAMPGWRERTIRICVDAVRSTRRVWVDGRLVKAWRAPPEVVPRLVVAGRDLGEAFSCRDPIIGVSPFLELPLDRYFNEGPDRPYAADASIDMDRLAGLRYDATSVPPRNIDLGKTAYRDAHMDQDPFRGLSDPYLVCDAMSSDPKRAIFRVPTRFYDRLHLLCYADGDEGEVPRAAVRFMQVERARFLTREFGLVPEPGVRVLETRAVGGKQCRHLAVDLNPAAFQEFLSEPENAYLEFELTRPVVIDYNSFEHPAGPPSSLHVIAMALEEAPVAMTVDSAVPGHLFERAEQAAMRIGLVSNRDRELSGLVRVGITRPDGTTRKQCHHVRLPARGEETIEVDVSEAPVGKSDFTVRLEVVEGQGPPRMLQRRTSFARLPAFERTTAGSPFGMWSFFEMHHGADLETTCGVLRKAGVRGTLANFVLATSQESWAENARRTAVLNTHGLVPNWGHLAGVAQTALDGLGDLDARFAWIAAHPQVNYYNLFWETRASLRAPTVCPPEIRGRGPRVWSAEERERIDTFIAFGTAWAQRARKDAPHIEISFGNGFPEFISAMLEGGFPLEYVDAMGLDFDMYTSAPEDQPSMWYAPFSGIFYLRELRKVYGCEEKPIYLTEAIYSPTSPIWITEREQADYYVRSHLLALAMGVERFGMCAEPIDPDGAYHYGHYGPVGLCHATPEMNPRAAYSAYAAMTGLLDGAQFDALVDVGSVHVFCLRFRKSDGRCVHALWTVNGSRSLDLQADGADELTIYNRDGRDITRATVGCRLEPGQITVALTLDESPQYLVGPERLDQPRLAQTAPIGRPGETRVLVRFDSLEGWEATSEPLAGYEAINPATPVAWADLDLAVEMGALRVRPPKVRATHPLETLCTTLVRVGEPLLIPSTAEAIGVAASGDRSWGRVVYVLKDQAGHRWISAHTQTPVDVDGQIYLETQLPKAPSGDHTGFRGYRPWKREPGDIVPEYPLRLEALLFETRSHVIHGPDLVPLSDAGFKLASIELR